MVNELTTLAAAFSLPASLIGGVLSVAIDRRPKPIATPKPSTKPNAKQIILNVTLGLSMYILVCYLIPNPSTRLRALIATGAIDYMIRRAYRRRTSSKTKSSDTKDRHD